MEAIARSVPDECLEARYLVKPVRPDLLATFFRDALSPARRVNIALCSWTHRYGLHEAETDVLRRSALGQERAEIALVRGTTLQTIQKQITGLLSVPVTHRYTQLSRTSFVTSCSRSARRVPGSEYCERLSGRPG